MLRPVVLSFVKFTLLLAVLDGSQLAQDTMGCLSCTRIDTTMDSKQEGLKTFTAFVKFVFKLY